MFRCVLILVRLQFKYHQSRESFPDKFVEIISLLPHWLIQLNFFLYSNYYCLKYYVVCVSRISFPH